MKLRGKNEQMSDSSNAVFSNLNMMSGDGPSRKKLKKDGLEVVDVKYSEVSVSAQNNNNFTATENNEVQTSVS